MARPRPDALRLTVFQSGNSPALRLPRALGFAAGERVLAFREGDALVVKRADGLGWPVGYFESWEASTLVAPPRARRGTRSARLDRLFGTKRGRG